MKQLPERSSLDHLKKQAKDLLRLYKQGDPDAIARFRHVLPGAADKDDAQIVSLALRLHDAQSCVAREYNFSSWNELRSYVEAQVDHSQSRGERVMRWLWLVYAGDTAGTNGRAAPSVAARVLTENPDLTKFDPYLACAVGDEEVLRKAVGADPTWVNHPGGPLNLPPLVAVTHSSLVRLPAFRGRLHQSVRFLLEAGADPNQSVGSRWPPASLQEPSDEHRLSALYGAAGQNHDPELTKLMLDAGANPNDGESLYHSLENPACARLLLEAGARIAGSNAFYRVFDLDDVELVELLLSYGADPNEPAPGPPTSDFGSPLMWAIRRRRSAAHVEVLLRAGADPFARTPSGMSAYRLALQFGLTEVAELLRQAGAADDVSTQERFIAACARGDETEARNILSTYPGLLSTLSESQLRLLPDLTAEGATEAVRLMVKLGWPIAVPGGDWQASALNLAVFRGDAELTGFLLEHGAHWTEKHGYGANVCGTLGWASCNEPVDGGDWLGCAQALAAHGMPRAQADKAMAGHVVIDGERYRFSQDVTTFLLGAHSGQWD